MAEQYKDQDPLEIAARAERDLNTYQAKTGHSGTGHAGSDSGLPPRFLNSPFACLIC